MPEGKEAGSLDKATIYLMLAISQGAFLLLSRVLSKSFVVPFPLDIVISAVVVWPWCWLVLRSRATVSFSKYLITLGAVLLVSVAAVMLPGVLRRHMAIQLAYAFPSLFLCLSVFVILVGVNPAYWQKARFRLWALGSLALSVAIAVAATFLA